MHKQANFYSNIWFIDVDKLCSINICQKDENGEYTLYFNIYFKPQDYVYIGLIISLLTLIILAALAINDKVKR